MTAEKDPPSISVDFKFMRSGWQHETRRLPEPEVKSLLKGAKLVDTYFWGSSENKELKGIVLKLKDGRKCELTHTDECRWGDYEGWIYISISEDWSE
jgi:hypothetical protein